MARDSCMRSCAIPCRAIDCVTVVVLLLRTHTHTPHPTIHFNRMWSAPWMHVGFHCKHTIFSSVYFTRASQVSLHHYYFLQRGACWYRIPNTVLKCDCILCPYKSPTPSYGHTAHWEVFDSLSQTIVLHNKFVIMHLLVSCGCWCGLSISIFFPSQRQQQPIYDISNRFIYCKIDLLASSSLPSSSS